MLCLLSFEILGGRDVMSAFLVLHFLGRLGDTKKIVHTFERKTLGLGDAV
jgi:hypothetical protein